MSEIIADPLAPESVEIPLQEREGDESSTSTSSFEAERYIKGPKLDDDEDDDYTDDEYEERERRGRLSTPRIEKPPRVKPPKSEGDIPRAVGPTFKTHSFDDPTFYNQESRRKSSGGEDSTASAQVHARSPPAAKARPRAMSDDDRDPDNINDVVKIRFEEVFAEPEGIYSFGTVWGASFRVFSDSKLWCYRFLSSACAVPCALCWGVHFACLTFCQIWTFQPCIRSFKVQAKPLSKMYSVVIKYFIEPCYEAFGLIFSSIRIHKSVD